MQAGTNLFTLGMMTMLTVLKAYELKNFKIVSL